VFGRLYSFTHLRYPVFFLWIVSLVIFGNMDSDHGTKQIKKLVWQKPVTQDHVLLRKKIGKVDRQQTQTRSIQIRATSATA